MVENYEGFLMKGTFLWHFGQLITFRDLWGRSKYVFGLLNIVSRPPSPLWDLPGEGRWERPRTSTPCGEAGKTAHQYPVRVFRATTASQSTSTSSDVPRFQNAS